MHTMIRDTQTIAINEDFIYSPLVHFAFPLLKLMVHSALKAREKAVVEEA